MNNVFCEDCIYLTSIQEEYKGHKYSYVPDSGYPQICIAPANLKNGDNTETKGWYSRTAHLRGTIRLFAPHELNKDNNCPHFSNKNKEE